MNDPALTPEQQVRLVEAIIEDTKGQPIPFDDFQDLVGLLCEDIAGLECLPEEQFAGLVSQLWSLYRALTSDDASGGGSLGRYSLVKHITLGDREMDTSLFTTKPGFESAPLIK